eukprot:g43929.t1
MSLVATAEEKEDKLKDLNVNKSPGPDGLHPIVLREIAEEIVEALVVIFQESLESGSIPEDRKRADILESIEDVVVEYLEVHSKIGLSQHSFIKESSCLTIILEEVMTESDEGESMVMIYLDFQKVFAKICVKGKHSMLVSSVMQKESLLLPNVLTALLRRQLLISQFLSVQQTISLSAPVVQSTA